MPYPDDDVVSSSSNHLLSEELEYEVESLTNEFNRSIVALTDEQRYIFNDILGAVNNKRGGLFFVYGYDGTGKTFLWKTMTSTLRCKGEIVLNVASSGIASLLLSGGRTTHSRFRIPLNVDEFSFCSITPDSDLACLVQKSSLIIWDEVPMIHKHSFEALDRTLNDVLKSTCPANQFLPFRGKVVVLGGDFRQILPVILQAGRQQIVNASLCSSYLWSQCKIHKLTKNMRLSMGTDPTQIEETKIFAKWLLDIGEGKLGGSNDGDAIIDIPEDILIDDIIDPVGSLIDFVYPSILQDFKTAGYFQERAILAPKNEVVEEINNRLLSLFPSEEKEYLSSDGICPEEFIRDQMDANLYSPDVLNTIKVSGLPNHKLILKIGVPIMLLRNFDQRNGLCNGTKLQVVSLGQRVIEAVIVSGSNIGNRTFITRMALTPSEKEFHINFEEDNFSYLYVLQ